MGTVETYDHSREDARPWVFGIATNLLRRHHRAEAKVLKAAARSGTRDATADDSDQIAGQVDAKVATGRIDRTLRSIAAIDREPLLLALGVFWTRRPRPPAELTADAS
jgi:RNA polymerase sigma-70 factor (ECF subfamily)